MLTEASAEAIREAHEGFERARGRVWLERIRVGLEYRRGLREIEEGVRESVKRFWSYGFRGADLIVACYGPAVGVFGKYERVEKLNGDPVEVPELLALARTLARDAIAGEFKADMKRMVDHLRSLRPRPGVATVLVPGDPEAAAREERTRLGIPLDEETIQQLGTLAAELGLEMPAPIVSG